MEERERETKKKEEGKNAERVHKISVGCKTGI